MTPIEKEELIAHEKAAYVKRLGEADVKSDVAAVHEATQTILENLFSSRLNVSWVREQCGITSNCFSQYFRHSHGETPHQYIWRHRMRVACRLLVHEGVDTFSIALSLGYARYRTFSRAFHRATGMTPTDYRARPAANRPELPPRPGMRGRSAAGASASGASVSDSSVTGSSASVSEGGTQEAK